MNRYLCIHGHFYQPPRENAWLEKIEIQPSAYPYHDWNERITQECYYPNAFSRVLNDEGKIIDIVNNYAKISFNIGATLLSWMEQHAPVTYTHLTLPTSRKVLYLVLYHLNNENSFRYPSSNLIRESFLNRIRCVLTIF